MAASGNEIVVLSLGGTIASKRSPNNVVTVLDPGEVQELLRANWPAETFARILPMAPMHKLSENMNPRDWVKIAHAVRAAISENHVRGVAILHGTDTMAFTSAALSILLRDCPVPVVLTGSMLTPDEPDSDAVLNLQSTATAIDSLPAGVYVCLDKTVHLGTNVGKLSGSVQPRFVSLNRRPVAAVTGGSIDFIEPHDRPSRPVEQLPGLQDAFDTSVISFSLFPGMPFTLLDACLQMLRGIVVQLYVSATAPSAPGPHSLPHFVKTKCAPYGTLVVATLPPNEGGPRGHPSHIYTSTLALEQAGVLIVDDMTPETAIVKLMWALAQSREPEVVRSIVATTIL